MIIMRKAVRTESNILNALAFESEAIWEEDENYMLKFSEAYCLTEEMIEKDCVYVMEEDERIIGFFALLRHREIPELELFYIEKSRVGHGYGTLLWNKMIDICAFEGVVRFDLVGSDDVADFYRKMGARVKERIQSTLKEGRIVTRFEFVLDKPHILE